MKALETMGETITKPELKVRTTVVEAYQTFVAGTSGMRRRTSTDTRGPIGRRALLTRLCPGGLGDAPQAVLSTLTGEGSLKPSMIKASQFATDVLGFEEGGSASEEAESSLGGLQQH